MFLKVESSSLRTNNRCCISVFYKLKTFCLCDSRYSGCSICVKIKVFRADLKLECLAPKSPNRGLKNVWLFGSSEVRKFGSSEVRMFGCLGVRVFNIQSINQKIKKSKNQTSKLPIAIGTNIQTFEKSLLVYLVVAGSL